MFMHYKWVKIEIANRRFLATRTFFQIWKSWPRYLGNGAQVLDFTLKKSEVQHPLDFTFFTVGLHFNKKWSPTVKKVKSNTRWTSLFLPLDFTLNFFKKTLDFTAESVLLEKTQIFPLGILQNDHHGFQSSKLCRQKIPLATWWTLDIIQLTISDFRHFEKMLHPNITWSIEMWQV